MTLGLPPESGRFKSSVEDPRVNGDLFKLFKSSSLFWQSMFGVLLETCLSPDFAAE